MSDILKDLTLNVSVKDTDIFKESLALLKEIYAREDIPKDVKDKILRYVDRTNAPGFRKIITCQNCGALLVDFDKGRRRSSHIHIKGENINIEEKGLITLKCNCGCKMQYRDL